MVGRLDGVLKRLTATLMHRLVAHGGVARKRLVGTKPQERTLLHNTALGERSLYAVTAAGLMHDRGVVRGGCGPNKFCTDHQDQDKDMSQLPSERFSGHESFVCRFGWLPKVFRAVQSTPTCCVTMKRRRTRWESGGIWSGQSSSGRKLPGLFNPTKVVDMFPPRLV